MTQTTKTDALARIVEAIRARHRFVISSHARPDGDSIGSQLAMACALKALGKEVRVINKDEAPAPLMAFAHVPEVEIADTVDGSFDASIIMECGDLARTGVLGLERFFTINIDHHPDNTAYGQLNWFDPTAAACGEMVYELIRALGLPLSRDMATHIYLAILTDTGSFRYSNISLRTFDICRDAVVAGVDPGAIARAVYESSTLGKLKLFGGLLNSMQLDPAGRIAVLYVDHEITRAAGGTYEDTEGLINIPLSVKEIEAVIFFRKIEDDVYRVSMRSKADVDISAVAKVFEGGGHKNAAGCTARGAIDELQREFVRRVGQEIDNRFPSS